MPNRRIFIVRVSTTEVQIDSENPCNIGALRRSQTVTVRKSYTTYQIQLSTTHLQFPSDHLLFLYSTTKGKAGIIPQRPSFRLSQPYHTDPKATFYRIHSLHPPNSMKSTNILTQAYIHPKMVSHFPTGRSKQITYVFRMSKAFDIISKFSSLQRSSTTNI